MNYLLSKYSCNPIVKEQKERVLKTQIKKMKETFTDFGFDRGFEVMRYVPLAERPSRTQPPPPPDTLISQLRNRRTRLRRTSLIRRTANRDFSASDSDDSSDLDIVETIVPANNTVNIAPPPPINIVIPPPPPPVETVRRTTNPPPPPVETVRRPTNPPPPSVETVRRPTNPPPPPPVSIPDVSTSTPTNISPSSVISINSSTNPFVASRQLPRTPVRNNNIDYNTRRNVSSMNNNLRLNLTRRSNINGLNFNI